MMTEPTLPVITTDSYPVRIGVAIDESLNVIFFNGQPNETISGHAAVAQQDGKRWACVLCKILDVVIEPNHCANQFNSTPTGALVALRSVVALCALLLPLYGLYMLLSFGWSLI
jgi:hypothetical protein